MGGMRTAGDLVAWMQMSKKMKIDEAKQYVAGKLGIAVIDLTNEDVMKEVRKDLDIGLVTAIAGASRGIAAKSRIADLLDITIPSVEMFKAKIGV